MTLNSWIKYDHKVQKVIVYVNVMLINANNIEIFFLILIYVNVMLIYVNNIDTNILKKFSFYYNFILIYVNITDRQTNISKV